MTRLLLAALVLAVPCAAQRRPAPARADTARRDTTAKPDSISRFLDSFTFRALGPAAYSGRVTAIAVPNGAEPRPKTFYIGAAGGGVWRTSDGGQTWTPLTDNRSSLFIGAVAIAPSNPLESALATSLVPGTYTAIVAGKNGGTGVGLVEVYNLP